MPIDASPIEFSLDVKGLVDWAHPKRFKNPGVIPLASGEPLKLQLAGVNTNDQAQKVTVTIRVLSVAGHQVWSEALDRSLPPGRTEITYELFDKPGAPQEGMFLAQVLSASAGKELAELVFGFFPAVPDIPETVDAPGLILRDRKVIGKIPIERTWPKLPDYTRHDPILAQAGDGELYVMFQEHHGAEEDDTRAQRPTFIWSTDGGRSWQMRQVTLDPPGSTFESVVAFGVVGDARMFVAYSPLPDPDRAEELATEMRRRMGFAPGEHEPDSIERYAKGSNRLALWVASSTDRGRTWSKSVEVDISKYARAHGMGRFYQGSDGAIWFNCTVIGPDKPENSIQELRRPYDALFRSSDGGKTWGDATLLVPNSAECQLLHLASGRWLTTIRSSEQPGDMLAPDGKLINIFGLDKLPTYGKVSHSDDWPGPQSVMHKRTFIAESKDGRDWGNFRQLTTLFGDTPGELIQLPDGRVVLLYFHRYSPHDGVYARVSHDEGRTWGAELLALRNVHSGYSSSTVLKDGTIVSMIGGETIQAVRWRLPAGL